MNKASYLLLVILWVTLRGNAQQACCRPSGSAAAFAQLSEDEKFRDSHSAPLPFSLSPQKGKMISFATPDGKKGFAYELKATKPVNKYLFIFHEWWGLNDYIKQEAEKWQAELGDINVYALDLYDGQQSDERDSAAALMSRLKEERAMALIKGLQALVGEKAEIATLGWCMGGTWSMQAALLLGPQAKTCIFYYGMPETNINKLQALEANVLGIFAKEDKWINEDVLKKWESSMDKAGKKDLFNFVMFDDANHAFANPSNPQYNREKSEAAAIKAKFFILRFLMRKM